MSAILEVHVQPGASREGIAWDPWRSSWSVRCREAPQQGEANARLLELLAGWLSVPLADLSLEHGARGRFKRVRVGSLDLAEAARRLGEAADAADASGVAPARSRPTGPPPKR